MHTSNPEGKRSDESEQDEAIALQGQRQVKVQVQTQNSKPKAGATTTNKEMAGPHIRLRSPIFMLDSRARRFNLLPHSSSRLGVFR